MAACLITINGTSGLLRLDYKISSISYSIEVGIGTLYIEDTATDVTYTTLTGDVTASSECFTITEVSTICYSIFWEGINTNGYYIDAIILNSEIIPLSNISFSNSGSYLLNEINDLKDYRIKVVGYKKEYNYESDILYMQYYYIFKILGSYIPTLRVRNKNNTNCIYIKGVELESCNLPDGYVPIEIQHSTLTTTTSPL
jgi:hypothetical protein